MSASALETVAGVLLVFVVPGLAWTFAIFPEWWPVRGYAAALKVGTLGFVLSIAFTVIAGYALLSLSPAGFAASWSDPVLETVLALIAAVGAAVAAAQRWLRPSSAAGSPADSPDDTDPWVIDRRLERLAQEAAALRRAGRSASAEERRKIHERLEEIRSESRRIAAAREEEYV